MSKEILKVAIHEMDAVLRKYDIAGVFVLTDGEGNGEFKISFDVPSWTMLRFLKSGLHFKAYMKSKPIESNKTLNMVLISRDILAQIFMAVDTTVKQLVERFDIEQGKGEWDFGGG